MKKIDKKKKKRYNISDYVLLAIFIILVVVFIGLVIGLVIVKDKNDRNKINVSIPVVEDNLKTSIGVDISNHKKGDTIKYNFAIRNYNKKNINDKEHKYKIYFINEDKVKYILQSNDKDIKLTNNRTDYMKLKKKVKDEDIYQLTIKLNEKTKKNRYVYIYVEGE